MIGEHLDQYTYQYILQEALSQVPNTIDKREGSIIYDAIAPACAVLAQAYIELKGILIETYALTATGIYLDYRAAEQGLTRYEATYAVRRGYFEGRNGPKSIPVGSRFSTIDLDENLNYTVTGEWRNEAGDVVPGYYQLTCEVAGAVGDNYFGNLLPISFISDLSLAYMDDIVSAARDLETDEQLRARYQEKVDTTAFGGNIAQYRELILGLTEVAIGAVQIYPVWDGGGTVKCSILGSDYEPVTTTVISQVQGIIDPEHGDLQGQGLGLAPIGHKVTIATATPRYLDITADISVVSGADALLVQEAAIKAVEDYLSSVRRQWGVADESNQYTRTVYVSQINYAILSVAGVENVRNVLIDGEPEDVELVEAALRQELPEPGEVTINVS